jgi:hypothetical protein
MELNERFPWTQRSKPVNFHSLMGPSGRAICGCSLAIVSLKEMRKTLRSTPVRLGDDERLISSTPLAVRCMVVFASFPSEWFWV